MHWSLRGAHRRFSRQPAQPAERAPRIVTAGARDTDERHQTLKNTIQWSYDLLEAPEQQLFWCLAVLSSCCLTRPEPCAIPTQPTSRRSMGFSHSSTRACSGTVPLRRRTPFLDSGDDQDSRGTIDESRRGRDDRTAICRALPRLRNGQRLSLGTATDVLASAARSRGGELQSRSSSAMAQDEAEVAVRLAGSLFPFWDSVPGKAKRLHGSAGR